MSDEKPQSATGWVLGVLAAVLAALIVGGWSSVSGDVSKHETRITTLEERSNGVSRDLQEIKLDIKQLLNRK